MLVHMHTHRNSHTQPYFPGTGQLEVYTTNITIIHMRLAIDWGGQRHMTGGCISNMSLVVPLPHVRTEIME